MIVWRLYEMAQEKLKSISQGFLASQIGIERHKLSKLLIGQPERIDLLYVNRLCEALDIMPNDLFFYVRNDDPDMKKKVVEVLMKNRMSREEAERFIHTRLEKDAKALQKDE